MSKLVLLFLVVLCVWESSAQCDRRLEVNYPLFVYFNMADVGGYPIDSGFESKSIRLEIDTTETVCVENVYEGYLLRVSNYDSLDVSLPSVDRALLVYAEALIDAAWLPVTSVKASDCGNSYHCTNLKGRYTVVFSTPAFTGTYSTRLRYVLIYEGKKLYSNEINAQIHPEMWKISNFSEADREWVLDVNHYLK